MSQIVHTQWSCGECAASGAVTVTSYRTAFGIERMIPVDERGQLDPYITIKCPVCSGAGCVVGYNTTKGWKISRQWLEARLAEEIGGEPGP